MAKTIKKITGIAVAVDPLGYMVTYSYCVLEEATGNVLESNCRKSFVAIDKDLGEVIKSLYSYVEKRES